MRFCGTGKKPMKTDIISAVVPPSQENAPANAAGTASEAPTAADRTVTASTRLASGTGAETYTREPAASAERMGSTGSLGGQGDAGGQGAAARRVALSRTRLETMMLEAQIASSEGDVQRARSIARAVKMEAGAIRDALRSAADSEQTYALAAASAAQAIQDATEAARLAAARAATADNGNDGLAPWNTNDSWRTAVLAETAPLGTPTTNLHRSAFEALLRAQEILELLGRIDGGRLPISRRRRVLSCCSTESRLRTAPCWTAGTCSPEPSTVQWGGSLGPAP